MISCVQLFATSWTVAQAPLSMGISRQEYWSGLPFPPPGDLPNSGIKPETPLSPALAAGFFTTEPQMPLGTRRWLVLFKSYLRGPSVWYWDFPAGSDGKESTCNAGHPGSIPGSGRSLEVGNGNPPQYSYLGNLKTEETGGLKSMGRQRVRHNWVTNIHFLLDTELQMIFFHMETDPKWQISHFFQYFPKF